MRWDTRNGMLAAAGAAALIIHFWPMAYWSDTTIVVLRVTAALFIQLLFCRTVEYRGLRLLPLVLTTLLALWGGCLLLCSPGWAKASLAWYILDYFSPAITCAVVCLSHRRKP